MDLEKETELKNKVLDVFQELRRENLKLKLENEKLKKQLKDSEKFIHERALAQVEYIKENEDKRKTISKKYEDLKKRYDELYDSLYECETILREYRELYWRLGKLMPMLKKVDKRITKKYKYKVTHGETIVAGPPDSLFPPFGGFMSDAF